MRSIANGSIVATYQALGIPLGHAMRVLHFINNTDGDMFISFDANLAAVPTTGTDNIFIPADTFSLYDLTSDQDSTESFRYQNGTQVSIRFSSMPTIGSFYLVAIYGKGE